MYKSHRLLLAITISGVLSLLDTSVYSRQDESLKDRLSHHRSISLIQFLANPDRYHGVKVAVSGYLHWRFEDAALYLSKTDADYLNTTNAIWIQ
jgi:hypothetical protein